MEQNIIGRVLSVRSVVGYVDSRLATYTIAPLGLKHPKRHQVKEVKEALKGDGQRKGAELPWPKGTVVECEKLGPFRFNIRALDPRIQDSQRSIAAAVKADPTKKAAKLSKAKPPNRPLVEADLPIVAKHPPPMTTEEFLNRRDENTLFSQEEDVKATVSPTSTSSAAPGTAATTTTGTTPTASPTS